MHDDVKAAAQEAHFTLERSEEVPEIGGAAHVMRHEASGAKLLFLQNDDVDKSFSITFKTPAADDTGVFHILEHSVLCGSAKFPVKEPFVNLLKGSMQTFLNAMTFPDKTMYPVASTNMADLMNLTDVYLDAVFHPRIYQTPDIFRQEGWHLEALRADAEGAALEGGLEALGAEAAGAPVPTDPRTVRLSYNGVVYNEMKGALSEPESVLYDTLSAALFPDTTYRFESGGTPAAIPDLTYEAFLDAHARHYRADNAYIILYGDMDIRRMLTFLDAAYLSEMPAGTAPAPANPLRLQEPVVCMDAIRQMATAPDNACMALGYVVGTAQDVERAVAVDILMDALAGSNEAPLKRAVMDAQIADDFSAYLADSVLQPFVVMQLKGAKPEASDVFQKLVAEEVARLADGGLDRELLHAALSHAEFVMREHNFGMSDGVVYSMAAMNGWLYDDADALSYIKYESLFADLKAKVDTGWFEELLRQLVLESQHHAQARVVPVAADADGAEDARLARIQEGLTEEGLAAIEAEAAALVAAQMAPDPPEALACLPQLSVADLGDAPAEPAFAFRQEADGSALITHEVDTHGIVYATRYYDLSCVDFEELPLAAVLGIVLGRLDTDAHTAAEVDTLVQGKLGSLSFAPDAYEPEGPQATCATFAVSASCLAENAAFAAQMADEVLTRTRFADLARIRDMLVQRKVALEQSFAMSGHSAAANRALSYVSRTAKAKEQLSGMDFYWYLRQLLDAFDERGPRLASDLEELARRIFQEGRCALSLAGPEEAVAAYRNACGPLGDGCAGHGRLDVPEPHDAHEAFGVSSDVTFTVLAADRKPFGMPFSGAWLLASKMLSLGYLWNEVRVVGGAYGVGFSSRRGGQTFFHSYRDPKVAPTIQAFLDAPEWLRTAPVAPEEFEGYVVSTVASLDAPVKPRDLVRRQDTMHFTGCTPQDRARTRQELVEATLDEVRQLADPLEQLVSERHVCCVGNARLIEESGEGFTLRDMD